MLKGPIKVIVFIAQKMMMSLLAFAGYVAGIIIIYLESLCPFFLQAG